MFGRVCAGLQRLGHAMMTLCACAQAQGSLSVGTAFTFGKYDCKDGVSCVSWRHGDVHSAAASTDSGYVHVFDVRAEVTASSCPGDAC